ncbi:MAG: thiamine phosphate synthase [Candidatus Krumholzibacteria bacterium]|nr:thiamine phosphate synthase [Candidatus Krumholzibacteria bacterium]
MKPSVGRLHVITDEHVQHRFSHLRIAELAIAGGADTIQLRDKSVGSKALIQTAKAMCSLCHDAGVLLIINDRPDVAMAVGADGVHLGQNDVPIPVARALIGPSKLIGGSASTLGEALQVQKEGADYVGFGHIYATSSKIKTGPPQGVGPLRSVCEALHIPVVAIGGITTDNMGPVVDAGVWGVAVVGSVCAAQDPKRATKQLKDALQ